MSDQLRSTITQDHDGMWRVEVTNQHGDVLVRWFRSWHRAERYRMEKGGE